MDKGVATHSSILAWEIPWTEESGGLQSVGLLKELDETEHLKQDSKRRYRYKNKIPVMD